MGDFCTFQLESVKACPGMEQCWKLSVLRVAPVRHTGSMRIFWMRFIDVLGAVIYMHRLHRPLQTKLH